MQAAQLADGSEVSVWLLPGRLLGRFPVGADGALTQAVPVPKVVFSCTQTVQVVGTLTDGKQVALSYGIAVASTPFPYSDSAYATTHGPDIDCLTSRGVVVGVGEQHFDPTAATTRGQAATMLARILGLQPQPTDRFTDVAGSVHAGAIGALVKVGVMQGYSDGTFQPGQALTRAQLASLVARAAKLPAGGQLPFSDVAGDSHAADIAAAAQAGIVLGYADGSFGPSTLINRAQVSSMLVRLINRLEHPAG